jgi:HlyD family secretion protein
LAALVLPGCHSRESAPLYEKVAVERRTIVVGAAATGVIEPIRTVAVKSKASGEIMELPIETGQEVKAGQLLATIDPRQPRSNLAQARADLDVARSQLAIADTKQARADTLYQNGAIAETELEDAHLAFVTAQAQVVRAQAALDLAQDQMDDTRVLAPVDGTIITKDVELGTVISSPTRDVGGGSVLLTMANLDTVQIRTQVDETDIGMIRPGLPASISVDAFPGRSFDGRVLKIEPQATVVQNVTMFPVLMRISNSDHLLLPGMNGEVEIHVGMREDVPAVPYAALRTPRDVGSAAAVLGLDPAAVQAEIAQAKTPAPADSSPGAVAPPAGRPAGAGRGGQRGPASRGAGNGGQSGMRNGRGNTFIVFALRGGKAAPVTIHTGLTDLDYVEVLDGLAETDTVLVLPSASLIASQQQMRERIQRITGGGGIPGMQQNQGSQTPPPRR